MQTTDKSEKGCAHEENDRWFQHSHQILLGIDCFFSYFSSVETEVIRAYKSYIPVAISLFKIVVLFKSASQISSIRSSVGGKPVLS